DTAGITSYIGDDTEVVSFSVDAEGGDEEINIKSSNNDPKSSLLLVDANNKSDWHDAFIYKLEADENDIEIETMVISLETVAAGFVYYGNIVDEVTIDIDGDEYDVDSVLYYTDATFGTLSADGPDADS